MRHSKVHCYMLRSCDIYEHAALFGELADVYFDKKHYDAALELYQDLGECDMVSIVFLATERSSDSDCLVDEYAGCVGQDCALQSAPGQSGGRGGVLYCWCVRLKAFFRAGLIERSGDVKSSALTLTSSATSCSWLSCTTRWIVEKKRLSSLTKVCCC